MGRVYTFDNLGRREEWGQAVILAESYHRKRILRYSNAEIEVKGSQATHNRTKVR
jgi:hypothetical protein